MISLAVRAVGMVSSVGDTAPECAASVRAGVSRIAATGVMSRGLQPLRMGLVPPSSLAPMPLLDRSPRCSRQRRILRLAHAALVELDVADALPVLLVTSARDEGAALLADLAALPGIAVDLAASAHFAVGAAGVFLALRNAQHRVAGGECERVVILCADSMLELARLDALQVARRLLVDDVMDGFIPGEAAAAILVGRAVPGALAAIAAAGVEFDPFTWEGDVALTGDGLSRALHAALDGASAPVTEVWAGLDGAAWSGREWSIAARRSHRALDGGVAVHHPVEHFGHPGAALGGMLVALAAMSVARRASGGPALAWSISEEGLRGAARLERGELR